MRKSGLLYTVCAGVFPLMASTSWADLVGVLPATPGDTDYQAYYDTEADLTWLADANAGFGSVFDAFIIKDGTPSGRMTWVNANAWAASLDINGVTGWRLPYTPDIDPSCDQSEGPSYIDCTGSEMGNLFYNVLGGVANQSIATTHNDNYELFSNVQTDLYYWSTEAAWNDNYAWAFGFNNCGGCVDAEADKTGSLYAWAVHSGNAGAVPLPAAVVLFGSGFLAFMGIAGKKQRVQQLQA